MSRTVASLQGSGGAVSYKCLSGVVALFRWQITYQNYRGSNAPVHCEQGHFPEKRCRMKDGLMDSSGKKRLLKATEIATRLNISRAKVYQLMQTGEIRTVCIGAARRVRPKDLDDFILQNLVPRTSSK